MAVAGTIALTRELGDGAPSHRRHLNQTDPRDPGRMIAFAPSSPRTCCQARFRNATGCDRQSWTGLDEAKGDDGVVPIRATHRVPIVDLRAVVRVRRPTCCSRTGSSSSGDANSAADLVRSRAEHDLERAAVGFLPDTTTVARPAPGCARSCSRSARISGPRPRAGSALQGRPQALRLRDTFVVKDAGGEDLVRPGVSADRKRVSVVFDTG